MSRPTHRLLSAALVLALGVLPAPGFREAPPMTDEDVVRMLAAGVSTEEILREIGRREPAFDVSPEMLEELRRARLPPEVIDAMVARQRELDRRKAEAAAAEPPGDLTTLRIRLTPGTVGLIPKIDPQLAAEWELGNAPEDREFADLALYVACHTGDHVPDQWRSRSPLGRDFEGMRRHRLLAFVSATTAEGEVEIGRRLKLEVPPVLEVPIEPGEHDLTLGLAVAIGGRYRRVVDDRWDGARVGEDGLELRATAKGSRVPQRFRVRFEPPEPSSASDGD